MSSHYRVLPPTFLVNDIVRFGSHPVSGGGYAVSVASSFLSSERRENDFEPQDIWIGRKGDQQLCLKVLRVFLTDLDRQKLFKVVDSFISARRLSIVLRAVV
jgi:hypothetical protein